MCTSTNGLPLFVGDFSIWSFGQTLRAQSLPRAVSNQPLTVFLRLRRHPCLDVELTRFDSFSADTRLAFLTLSPVP